MPATATRRTGVLGAALAAGSLCWLSPVVAQVSTERIVLTEVARFDHQVTGVTVSEDGRIFVNFPRWTEDSPISVAEVVDGKAVPYPDEAWNAWRNAKKNEISAEDHWVCVQSVVADGRGSLWVLDPAAPATGFLVPGGPKLVRIDLATDKVAQVISFDGTTAPQGSYLNDVRFAPNGRHAYITDSGATGALIVVDLETGKARRLLSGHPSTQPEKDVVVSHEGKPVRRPDGRGAEFAADSIELSKDGSTLYWKPLTGRTLFSIPTRVLNDPNASADAVAAAAQKAGDVGVTDGLWLDESGRLYLSALEEDAIKVREGEAIVTLVQDDRLRWPDTFSQGPDGAIYVTASRIMDMAWYKPDSPAALPTRLYKFTPGAELAPAVPVESPKDSVRSENE
ncbi:MAG: L-dopachrome tautomerase-related protein [Geminicoccaceae bacterium]